MKKNSTTRREFLKASAASAAGLAVTGMAKSAKAQTRGTAWTSGMQINSNIDNLRVVCCHDTDMVTGDIISESSFSAQNDLISTSRVHENIDKMARVLSQASTYASAWSTIFQKPSSKEWNQVKVAFKVNGINTGVMHHIAIIDKLCRVLNSLGVEYSNMIIFDGDHNAYGSSKYSPYATNGGLPSGVIVSNRNGSLGDSTSITVPHWDGSDENTTYDCTTHIADGTIDILINCAVNKGHSSGHGSCTLTMKNHIGTIKYSCPSYTSTYGTNVYDLTNVNKTDAIIGGTPPRQQLCLIDSIIGAVSGPSAGANHTLHRIVMGTFSPAVDYLTVKKIREPSSLMNASHNQVAIKQFLSFFNYTDQEIENIVDLDPDSNNDKGWVEFDPDTDDLNFSSRKPNIQQQKVIELKVKSNIIKLNFNNNEEIKKITINDIKGRQIQNLAIPKMTKNNKINLSLNTKNIPAGTYVLMIQGEKTKVSEKFVLR